MESGFRGLSTAAGAMVLVIIVAIAIFLISKAVPALQADKANFLTTSIQAGNVNIANKGNVQLNDGLFAKAADIYKQALTHWDHPAIHYNLALALMNLDQPIDSQENFQMAVKFGDAPLQSKDKFDHAKDYILLLDKQIGEVEVTCNKPGTKVSLDGKEVFTAPGTWRSLPTT